MTIASEVVPRITYSGDGAQTSYPYPWLVLASSDLAVYQNGELKILGVHYTLSSVGAPTGGNVIFTLAPGSGDDLVFLRDTEATQNTTLSDTGPANMTAIERMADRLTMLVQEVKGRFARIPLLSIFSDTENPTLGDPHAGWPVRWDDTGTELEPFDPTTILPTAATLPLSVANGGSNASTALGARQSFGLDGRLPRRFVNLTGGSLVAGDVVALDTATDSTVVLDDTVSSKALKAVALATIAHAATGEFTIPGVTPVNVTGTVVSGRYLRKSATTLVAEDSGVLHGAATDPPEGSFGVALTGDAGGQVLAYLFGFTYPGNTAPTITGLARVHGLTGANNAGTPNTQFDVAALSAVVRDPVGGGTLVLPTVATRTLDLSLVGPAAGGRDEVSAFSANTWIHCYLIAKTDGTYHVTASTTGPPTGPAFPTDYTLWAYLGALRVNNGSQIPRTRLRGAWAYYDAQQNALTDGAATVETAVSLAALVPPTALSVHVHASAVPSVGGLPPLNNPRLRVVTGQDFYTSLNNSGNASGSQFNLDLVIPNVSQQLFYLWANAPLATNGLYLNVAGYENPV